MKPKNKKSLRWILVLAFLLTATLILSACNPSTPKNVQENGDEQKNEVYLPAAGSESNTETEAETESEEVAYPDSKQDGENTAAQEAEPYPASEEETAEEMPDPTLVIEPTKGPQPTSRGNELFATNPSSVSLASGQVQLVELFAFW